MDVASEEASKEVFRRARACACARKPFIMTTQLRIRKVNEVARVQTKMGDIQKRFDIGGLP